MEPIYIGGYSLTQILIIAGVVFYSLYDLFAQMVWGRDETISVVFIDICRRSPEITFVCGLVIGHIFLHIPNK